MDAKTTTEAQGLPEVQKPEVEHFTSANGKKWKLKIDIPRAIALYDSGLSCPQIASILGTCGKDCVRSHIKKFRTIRGEGVYAKSRNITTHPNMGRRSGVCEIPEPLIADVKRRLLEIVIEKNDNGCWIVGPPYTKGYRGFAISGIGPTGRLGTFAHRASYMAFKGRIPEGLQVDHKCRNTHCINPDHLRPLTQRDNVLAGVGVASENAKKKFCKRGHPLSGDNLRIVKTKNSSGFARNCKACAKMHDERYRKIRRATRASLSEPRQEEDRTQPVEHGPSDSRLLP